MEGRCPPFPSHNLGQVQPRHPHCHRGRDSTDDGPRSTLTHRNCKGSAAWQEPWKSSPLGSLSRKNKLGDEIQRSICHSICSKTCWKPQLSKLETSQSTLGGSHGPGGAGTTWLGSQRDSRKDMGRRKGRASQHLSSAAWKGQASSSHDQKLDRTCP